MSTPHKHAALIHAWADGAEIQSRRIGRTDWIDGTLPTWSEEVEYRVKPHKWQKEIDAYKAGKTVQHLSKLDGEWTDNEEPTFSLNHEWRIKPELIRYRAYMWKTFHSGEYVVSIARSPSDADHSERDPEFLRWLGDWQDVEV